MVSCFLCCWCFGSLLFTTCVLLGSFVIFINLLFIDKKKNTLSCRFKSLRRISPGFLPGFMGPLCMGRGRISGMNWGLLGGYGEILGA